jgi:uncharacterized membrane protein HdeD (DUF308 family)
MMPVSTVVKLGYASNLPTVWTNVLAGVVLSGAPLTASVYVPVVVAASLLYLAGMFLNDAFEHRWHRWHRVAPLVMGLCRVGVYALAAFAATPTPAPPAYVGAVFLLCYLVLLTLVARNETKNPKRPVLVARLIAGISLVDGLQLLAFARPVLAGLCAGAFVLTLGLQRRFAGT